MTDGEKPTGFGHCQAEPMRRYEWLTMIQEWRL